MKSPIKTHLLLLVCLGLLAGCAVQPLPKPLNVPVDNPTIQKQDGIPYRPCASC